MRYIAFLRGINVGAHNRIKMADFRSMLEGLGHSNVETYIQSGNAVFDAEECEAVVEAGIVGALAGMGVRTDVVLRTAEELAAIVDALPFGADEIRAAEAANEAGKSLYVCLFSAPPPLEGASRIEGEERFRLIGRDGYMLLRQSIRHSKLAAGIGKRAATVRNWNTILKLCEMGRTK